MGDDKDSTFEREREIFFAALEKKTEGSRADYLQGTCGDDAAMLDRVREMLDQHHGDETETFLKPQDIPQLPGTLMEREGAAVGNYKLVEKLGEGGFGVVWMAEQEKPVKRKVALKLIKPGMDSAEVIARFGAERQALAVMDHPNIAKVFDAGATESGRPYFVMELADGVPITEFCDREKLNTKERLELFATVCGAVQHAHQKAVIHRDLKPSNILVVDGDDGPVPKVIDFGIAKAIGEDAGAQTAFTAHGQLVGTPQYMSPEQAGMGGAADIDTRSDVYSLGVVLYELLAGSPPFDAETLRSAGFEGMCRIIREEEPPRPSLKLGTASGEEATRIADTRGSGTEKLSRQVRGELDWIVMKAIEKDRGRRYETANAFAADIGRYLNDEPVKAAAPSAAYRFKKFARRNKAVLGTAAVVALVLIAATWVSVWQAVEAHRARVQSDKDKEEAEAISEFMVDVFQSPDPARDGRTITVAEMLDTAAKKLETELADQPGRRAKLQAALGRTYLVLGLYFKATTLMEEVRDYHLATSGEKHPDTLVATFNLAASYGGVGRRDEGIEMYEQVLPLCQKELGAEHSITLEAMDGLAGFYNDTGRVEEAINKFEEVLRLSRKALGVEHPGTLSVMDDLATCYHNGGRRDEALEMREEVLRLRRKVFGVQQEHPDMIRAIKMLASSFNAAGRKDEAIEMLEEVLALSRNVLGEKHPDTLRAMGDLAFVYNTVGRLDEALRMREETLALSRKILGEEHRDTVQAMTYLAYSYEAAGRLGEALKLREEAVGLSRKVLGHEHPNTLIAMGNLALSYHGAGRLDEALEMQEKVLALSRNLLGEEHPDTLIAKGKLALSYHDAGRRGEALRMQKAVLVLFRKVHGAEHPYTLVTMIRLARFYRDAGRLDEAVNMREDVLELSRKVHGREHPETLSAMRDLVACYAVAGHPAADSTKLVEEMLALSSQVLGVEHPDTVLAMGILAESYSSAGRVEEAIGVHEKALVLFRKVLGSEHPRTLAEMTNLAVSLSAAGRQDEALKLREEVLKLSRKVLGDEHNDTLDALNNLAVSYRDTGRLDDAGILWARALVLRGRQVGIRDEREIAQGIFYALRVGNTEIPAEEPSDTAVAAYYNRNKERFSGDSIHLLMLSIPKFTKKRDDVETLREDLAKGGDFADAAKEHSDDSAAARGGDRGWVKRGYFSKDMDEAAFALEAGEVSEVIEDATHFRILKVAERKEGTPPPLDEVREEIAVALKEESRKKRVAGWIEEAKEELAKGRKAQEEEKVKDGDGTKAGG